MSKEALGKIVQEALFEIDTGDAIKPGFWRKDDIKLDEVSERYKNGLLKLFEIQLKDYERLIAKEKKFKFPTLNLDSRIVAIGRFLENLGVSVYDSYKPKNANTIFLVHDSKPAYDMIMRVPDGVILGLFNAGLISDLKSQLTILPLNCEENNLEKKVAKNIPEADKCRLVFNALSKMQVFSPSEDKPLAHTTIAEAFDFLCGRALYWAKQKGYVAFSLS